MNYDSLEKLLKERKLSRRKLAKIIGISPNTLTSAINANSQTGIINTPTTLQHIANALECDVYDLLTISELQAWGILQQTDKDRKLTRKVPLKERIDNHLEEITFFSSKIDLKNRDVRRIYESVLKLNDVGKHELSKRALEMTRLEEYVKETKEREDDNAP
jgi:Helix-turn-helix.